MSRQKQILIIDDDVKLCQLLKTYLAQYDLKVASATRPEEGMDVLRKLKPSLVILDVMLPGKDGFEVCRDIRGQSKTPIIMLTARGEVADRVIGLELGADDYLSKPFEPRELVARIQSVLRRFAPQEPSAPALQSGSLQVDLQKRTATLKGKNLNLTTTEFEILAFFLKNPGAVMSRDQIMDDLRGIEWEAFNRSVDVAISRLRKKLGDSPESPRYFKTVWGSGYVFVGKVAAHEATR